MNVGNRKGPASLATITEVRPNEIAHKTADSNYSGRIGEYELSKILAFRNNDNFILAFAGREVYPFAEQLFGSLQLVQTG